MVGRGRGGFAALVALIATALLVPAAAHATPPTITDAGESPVSPGFLTAHWTLPAGMESYYVYVSTTPRTATIGAFRLGVLIDFLAPTDTAWGASAELPPGTYYLHVSALDTAK